MSIRPATGLARPLRAEIDAIERRLFALRDPATGLYETFQDAEDEYVHKPFSVYDNVLAWKALNDLAALDRHGSADLRARCQLRSRRRS